MEEIGLKKVIKKKEPPKNQTDFLEKIETQRSKREEKEKLKYLEKLESKVLKFKKKSNNNTTITSNINEGNNNNNLNSHRRLIDNLPKEKEINEIKNLFNKKLLDDPEFRKNNIKKEKLEIICDANDINNNAKNQEFSKNKDKNNEKNDNHDNNNEENENENDEIAEAKFLKSLPKDKLKFFMFKASQIYNFLKSIKLVRYIEIFIEDGFEDIESILGNLFIN